MGDVISFAFSFYFDFVYTTGVCQTITKTQQPKIDR